MRGKLKDLGNNIYIHIYVYFTCQSYLNSFLKKIEIKMGIHTKTCIQMLTVSLFTIAKRQKQPK